MPPLIDPPQTPNDLPTVDGDEAERVRLAFLDRYVPARVRDLLARDGGPLGPGHPVVRLLPR